MEENEVWKNNTKSQFWVGKKDFEGKDITVQVLPGATVEVTTKDRMMNQARTANKEFDWFSNGALSPVHLIEDAKDYAQVKSNPNTLSDDEIIGLIDLTPAKLKAALADISSTFILQRLSEYVDSDEGAANPKLSMGKVNAIKERNEEVNPKKTGVKVSQTIEEVVKKPIETV